MFLSSSGAKCHPLRHLSPRTFRSAGASKVPFGAAVYKHLIPTGLGLYVSNQSDQFRYAWLTILPANFRVRTLAMISAGLSLVSAIPRVAPTRVEVLTLMLRL
jgi:hypothetical protein